VKNPIKIAAVALGLFGGVVAVSQPATADNVSVAIGAGGGIAFGYSDGYWDRSHNWHAWRNAEEAAAWRRENAAHYYDWHHDRDRSMGWHEERWWDAHH